MQVVENPRFTRDYFDADKRYIGNSVQVFFTDGSSTEKVSIDFPIGHRKRRGEGIPVLLRKFEAAVRGHFDEPRAARILDLVADPAALESTPIDVFMGQLAT